MSQWLRLWRDRPPANGTTSFLTIATRRMTRFKVKRLFLLCFFPMLLDAQTAQLIEQLGKTVLYRDVALSPDGTHVAWVESTAATTTSQTYLRAVSGNETATMLNFG